MTALTDQDKRRIWRRAYLEDKAVWKALPNLPNKNQIGNALDIIQTAWDALVTENKSAVDTALGQATSAAQLRSFARAWLRDTADRLPR